MKFRKITAVLAAAAMAGACVPVNGISAETADPTSIEALAERASSRYGYRDAALRENGKGRQAYYNDLMKLAEAFWDSDADIAMTDDDGHAMYIVGELILDDYGITSEDALETFFMFRNDNPIFYFVSNEFYYGTRYTRVNGTYQAEDYMYLQVYPEFTEGAVRKDLNAKVLNYIDSYATCIGSGYYYDDARAVYEQLGQSMEYAYEADGVTPSDTTNAHTIIGAVVDGSGVCEAYARTYEMICNYYGIENIYVSGTALGGGHAWNVLRMDDGGYYFADCTYDDMTTGVDDYYFAKGSELFSYDHKPKTPQRKQTAFLYALPEIGEADFVPGGYPESTAPPETIPTEPETSAPSETTTETETETTTAPIETTAPTETTTDVTEPGTDAIPAVELAPDCITVSMEELEANDFRVPVYVRIRTEGIPFDGNTELRFGFGMTMDSRCSIQPFFKSDEALEAGGEGLFSPSSRSSSISTYRNTLWYEAAWKGFSGENAALMQYGANVLLLMVTLPEDVQEGDTFTFSYADTYSDMESYVTWNGIDFMGMLTCPDGTITVGNSGTETPGVTLYGDVDENGSVDLLDVILLNKNLMIGTDISDQGMRNADVDNNGAVNAVDSLNILKYAVKLINLPVE